MPRTIRHTPSKLQKVARAVNYAIGFRLQYLHFPWELQDLPLSLSTRKLIAQHEQVTQELKLALRRDYVAYSIEVKSKRLKS